MYNTTFGAAEDRSQDLSVRNVSLVGRLRDWRAKRREYNRVYDELTRMGAREMDELGITQADFHAIARGTFRRV